MKFEQGEIVLIGNGKVHWEVMWLPAPGKVWLKSGLTGRYRLAHEHQLKPWTPGG